MVCDGRLQGLGGNEEFRSENSECRIKNAEAITRNSQVPLRSLRILCDLCGKKLLTAEIAKPTRRLQRRRLRSGHFCDLCGKKAFKRNSAKKQLESLTSAF